MAIRSLIEVWRKKKRLAKKKTSKKKFVSKPLRGLRGVAAPRKVDPTRSIRSNIKKKVEWSRKFAAMLKREGITKVNWKEADKLYFQSMWVKDAANTYLAQYGESAMWRESAVLLEDVRVRMEITEAKAATVDVFLTILTGQLTRYDKSVSNRERKRGRANIYRLGHLLGAVGKIRDDVKGFEGLDTPEALGRLKKSLAKRFTSLAPVDRVVKMIDAYLKDGTMPKYK